MEYVKIEQIAQLWGISTRRVQTLCAQGRIEGTVRFGRDWMIPQDAQRPADGRTKVARDAASADLLAVEPMISQTMADRSLMSEAYLRMICAVVYNTCGNTAHAIRHLDRAISLVLPDQLYGFLAEFCRALGPLLEQRLALVDPDAWKTVRNLYKLYNEGWSKLSGTVRGRTIITTLSSKERAMATLAAFGMQNSEIAEKLHMSLSGVKQAIRIVSEKTGVSRDEFAAYL